MSSISMPIAWRKCFTHGWRPEAREGATLTTIFVPNETNGILEERAYLFGGLSRTIYASLGYLSLNSQKSTPQFFIQIAGYVWKFVTEGNSAKKRYGHAAVECERKLVIIGGSRLYSNETKRRECLNDILIFDPSMQSWTEIMPEGVHFDPRRHHSVCTVGKQLVVYGGINGSQVYCSDLLSINLLLTERSGEHRHRWITVRTSGISPGNLAYHTSKLVLHPDRYRMPGLIALNSLPDVKAYRSRIEVEGIYFFGGRDEKGPNNRLHILKVGQKICEWIQPAVSGKPPLPRYGHSMNYYSNKGVVILFGGRNDELFSKFGDAYLDDVWVLMLAKLTWVQWNKEGRGAVPVPRYLHCMATIGGSIVVFGGLGTDNYCRSEVYALDMEAATNKWATGGKDRRADNSKMDEISEEEQKDEYEKANTQESNVLPTLPIPINPRFNADSSTASPCQKQPALEEVEEERLQQLLLLYN
eukprot:TRINITY_DN1394_c0_g1_i2.p1 TRINITY_DN1394_c0_g1~~TRINITY_DN1394_c0_g1_i2.p1  ORF type:complete len:472 (-),score=24.31 TRINITY_DN1394_c0_g1_i2:3555-4970(-)